MKIPYEKFTLISLIFITYHTRCPLARRSKNTELTLTLSRHEGGPAKVSPPGSLLLPANARSGARLATSNPASPPDSDPGVQEDRAPAVLGGGEGGGSGPNTFREGLGSWRPSGPCWAPWGCFLSPSLSPPSQMVL